MGKRHLPKQQLRIAAVHTQLFPRLKAERKERGREGKKIRRYLNGPAGTS